MWPERLKGLPSRDHVESLFAQVLSFTETLAYYAVDEVVLGES